MTTKRRVHVDLSIDPDLLAAVDAQVARDRQSDRGAVIDEALRIWMARQQDVAMERQIRTDGAVGDGDAAAWRRIRRAAVRRLK
jgi:metal-responsive CopG/Arc/MetJ family transcriptional regulator